MPYLDAQIRVLQMCIEPGHEAEQPEHVTRLAVRDEFTARRIQFAQHRRSEQFSLWQVEARQHELLQARDIDQGSSLAQLLIDRRVGLFEHGTQHRILQQDAQQAQCLFVHAWQAQWS